jgi:hypothetical protein
MVRGAFGGGEEKSEGGGWLTSMNKNVVLFHLREAAEELNQTIANLERDSSYDEVKLSLAMGHLYHHSNTAWNGRNQTDEEFSECSDESFNKFRRFPSLAEFPYLEE